MLIKDGAEKENKQFVYLGFTVKKEQKELLKN